MVSSKASYPSGLSSHSSSNPLPAIPGILPSGDWLFTTAAIIVSLLVLEQSVYRYKKRHLPGATWTIPIIGKFADSMKPTMEGYMKQWASGALSAISVFNVCVANPMFAPEQGSMTDTPSILTHLVSSSWPPRTSFRVKSSTRQLMLSLVSFTLQSRSCLRTTGK